MSRRSDRQDHARALAEISALRQRLAIAKQGRARDVADLRSAWKVIRDVRKLADAIAGDSHCSQLGADIRALLPVLRTSRPLPAAPSMCETSATLSPAYVRASGRCAACAMTGHGKTPATPEEVMPRGSTYEGVKAEHVIQYLLDDLDAEPGQPVESVESRAARAHLADIVAHHRQGAREDLDAIVQATYDSLGLRHPGNGPQIA